MNFPSIYLASGSPRRRELLEQIGVEFAVIQIEVDETNRPAENPHAYIERITKAKVTAGWQKLLENQLTPKPVLAADTCVVFNSGQIAGKPQDKMQAHQFLSQLSGQQHQVITCVAIQFAEQVHYRTQLNHVSFSSLSESEIDWYLKTEEGMDKAGGYAVQGLAAMFIEHIAGSFSGIMGLPLYETRQLLQQAKQYEQ